MNTCLNCSNELVRKKGEWLPIFLKRKYCNSKCYGKYKASHEPSDKSKAQIKRWIEEGRARGGWAKGIKHSEETRLRESQSRKGKKHTEEEKEKIRQGMIGKNTWMKGRKLSQETRKKMSDSRSGEKAYQWKGNAVGYWGLHVWIRKMLGRPQMCSYCKTNEAKKYEWANISHRYKRELNDWIRLCKKCHNLYDRGKIDITR